MYPRSDLRHYFDLSHGSLYIRLPHLIELHISRCTGLTFTLGWKA